MSKNKSVVATAELIETKYTVTTQQLEGLLRPLFKREETRISALAYVRGLLSRIDRKNSWQLAEESGLATPYAFQYLLGRALWDDGKLQSSVSQYMYNSLDSNGILAIDETGFIKKGNKSAGVARQYSGTAGRIENSQIGVFLSYTTSLGRTLIDRELYLPKDWIKDEDRRKHAGVPLDIEFKTKPELAKQMLERAFSNGVKANWVVGDNVYGCWSLRSYLEERCQQYVLAVPSNHQVYIDMMAFKANELAVIVKEWRELSAGNGAKGPRTYAWSIIKINAPENPGYETYLLLRKSLAKPDEIAYYVAFAKINATLAEIVEATGSRWSIEECFEVAKAEVGLDQYEVRSYTGWYRHITLSLLALAFLNQLSIEVNADRNTDKKKTKLMQDFLLKRGLG